MADIPVVLEFDETKKPIEGDTNFRANASYVWSRIYEVITSFNTAIQAFNDMINATNINVNNVGVDIAKGAGTNTATDSAVLNALANADQARLDKWEAKAVEMTTTSQNSQPVGEFVREYTSNGNGTFTETITNYYSALHYFNSYSSKVSSYTGQDVGSNALANVVWISQANYDALTPNANTLYLFVG